MTTQEWHQPTELEKIWSLAAPTSGYWAGTLAWRVYRVVRTGELVVRYSAPGEVGKRLIPVREAEIGWVFDP
jgi:hypothetical protein